MALRGTHHDESARFKAPALERIVLKLCPNQIQTPHNLTVSQWP